MSHRRLIHALCELLASAEAIVRELDPDLFRRVPEPLGVGSVGAHVRHVLDACRALPEALERGGDETVVDYGRRERDVRIEEDPAHALRASRELRARLERLALEDAARPVLVRPERAGREALEPVGSTLARELEALRSHTLHHYAMVATFLRHFGVEVDAAFGVAPSTLEHWEATRRCAPLPG